MSKTRAKISKRNKWYVAPHRFYELYHFCLQYKEWIEEYDSLDGIKGIRYSDMPSSASGSGDQLEKLALRRLKLRERIDLIRRTAEETEPAIAKYLIRSVTEDGCTYDKMCAQGIRIPCGRRLFYDRRRKFFYILAREFDKRY